MKLSKKLFSSGVLGNGQVRHCSDWEFDSTLGKSRFGVSPTLRKVMERRAAMRKGRRIAEFPAAVVARFFGK